MTLYKKNSPEDFYNWLSKGRTMEIRFLSDYTGKKFADWSLIRKLGEELGIDSRFNSLFISNYNTLQKILLYKIGKFPLTRLYNIFISVNPKRKVKLKSKKGLLYDSYYGGIAGTSHIQTILCDIEHIGERKENATETMLEECIQGAEYLIKVLDLTNYYINISGNGVHLWIAMNPEIDLPLPSFREVTIKEKDTIKYNLKEEPIRTWIKTYNLFIEKLNKNLKLFNPNLKVDEGAKDIARIARPPGSWNVKKGKTPRAVGTVSKNNKINILINQKFLAVQPLINKESQELKQIKVRSKNHRYNALNIRESPLYKLLTSQLLPSTLSRNHFLEQSFARLLRDNDITIDDVEDVVYEIDEVQQKTVQVDPDYLDDFEIFNPETINSYCFACRLPFVYKIMEDIQVIADGFISEEHYKNLNSYSEKTVLSMAVKDWIEYKVPDSYFKLKTLIRNLVDKYERATVFFTLKALFKDDWEYFDNTKLIQTIMNKTRRRKNEN